MTEREQSFNNIDYRVFNQANDCVVGDVEAKLEAFSQAKNCKAERVHAMHVFQFSENCSAVEVNSHHAFTGAKNCFVNKLISKNSAFWGAEHCIANTIKTEDSPYASIFNGAVSCQANTVEGSSVLQGAEKCFVYDSVKARNLGQNSLGVVVLGKVDSELTHPSVQIIDADQETKEYFRDNFEDLKEKLYILKWEGSSLKDGLENLNNHWQEVKDRDIINKVKCAADSVVVRPKDFYYAVSSFSNKKRIELLSSIDKLSKEELNSFKEENFRNYLGINKEYLVDFSFKELAELGKFIDFLKPDIEQDILEIRNSFPSVDDQFIEKSVNGVDLNLPYSNSKVLGLIKKLEGKEISKSIIKKEWIKEINDKKKSRIKDFIKQSHKEELLKYLKNIGLSSIELSEDNIFALRVHKRIDANQSKAIIEGLLKGDSFLDYKPNMHWINSMKDNLNINKWIGHYQKEYTPENSSSYYLSIEKKQEEQIEEIKKHLKNYCDEDFIDLGQIELIVEKNKEKIPEEYLLDIKNRINIMKSSEGIKSSPIPKKIIVTSEEDPIKTLQMGEHVSNSCLSLFGNHTFAIIANAVDVNKKIAWIKDENDNILGRILMAITEEGKLVGFRAFENDPRINIKPAIKDFLHSYAQEIGTKVANEGKIAELVTFRWHNDGIKQWK
ncbi:MAG: hypothetical protein PHV25_01700 [Candidatus Pacebacteria bacterium]|nr:hypothetical protein [Candidatus Paceibacterota bacterium]